MEHEAANTLILWPSKKAGSWRRLLAPATEGDHRAHRIELGWQNSLGMTILGLVGMLYAAACCTVAVLSESVALPPAMIGFGITMGFSGLAVILGGQTNIGRAHPRWIVALLLVGLSFVGGLGHADSPLVSTTAQVPLLLVLTVAVMVFRPLQALLLAATSLAGMVAGAAVGNPQQLGSLAVYGGLLASGAVVLATLLYHLRWKIAERRLELVRQRSYLERQNEELRRQTSHVLDVAQSSKLQSLASLSAGVAHEINTPIGSIQANVEVMEYAVRNLREQLGNSDDRRAKRSLSALDELLPLTHEAAQRVSGIVDQLKQFARLDRASRAPVDLHEGLDSALALLRFRLHEQIDVVKEYGDVPLVVADAERINQAFMNLLCNAVQAIDEDGEITVSTDVSKGRVVVRIADNGRGIAPDDLPRIFDPGFTTRGGVGVGTGLGLAIAQRIVEAHDGTIAVDSEPGKGTTVTIELPTEGRPR